MKVLLYFRLSCCTTTVGWWSPTQLKTKEKGKARDLILTAFEFNFN